MSRWTLHHGDCLDPVSGLASLADKSADVVISDPPYEAEAHTEQRRQKGVCTTVSGTLMLGRRFVGWERDAKYHAIATRRINGDEAKPREEQPGLFDAIGGAR